jgi:hypothetical protein
MYICLCVALLEEKPTTDAVMHIPHIHVAGHLRVTPHTLIFMAASSSQPQSTMCPTTKVTLLVHHGFLRCAFMLNQPYAIAATPKTAERRPPQICIMRQGSRSLAVLVGHRVAKEKIMCTATTIKNATPIHAWLVVMWFFFLNILCCHMTQKLAAKHKLDAICKKVWAQCLRTCGCRSHQIATGVKKHQPTVIPSGCQLKNAVLGPGINTSQHKRTVKRNAVRREFGRKVRQGTGTCHMVGAKGGCRLDVVWRRCLCDCVCDVCV